MKIIKFLPSKTKLNNLSKTVQNIKSGDVFCVESFSAYINRHKNLLNVDDTLDVFINNKYMRCYEFIREFVINYLYENSYIKINKSILLKQSKDIIKSIKIYSDKNIFRPQYKTTITGRISSTYQSFSNVSKKHMLSILADENLISVDCSSFAATTYLNIMNNLGYNMENILNNFYKYKLDIYIYFFLDVFFPKLAHDYVSNIDIVIEKLKENNQIKHLINDSVDTKDIKNIIRNVGKKILIPSLYMGEDINFKRVCNIMRKTDKIVKLSIANSSFKIYKWVKFILDLKKSKGSSKEDLYGLYIPDIEYLNNNSTISSYVLDNIGNYSMFFSITRLIQKGIVPKAYFFDEILISEKDENKEIIRCCFLNNGLVPLKVKL